MDPTLDPPQGLIHGFVLRRKWILYSIYFAACFQNEVKVLPIFFVAEKPLERALYLRTVVTTLQKCKLFQLKL